MALEQTKIRTPQILLWGVFFIVIVFVSSQLLYFLLSTANTVEAQFSALEEEIHEHEHEWVEIEATRAADQVDYALSQSKSHLKEMTKVNIKQVISIANSLYLRYRDKYTEEQLKELIVETLRPIRFFNGRGYLFISDFDGMVVLSPPRYNLEGSRHEDNKRIFGLLQQTIETVSNPSRSGYMEYRFPTPYSSMNELQDKIAYLEVFEPFGWIIGSGDYVDEVQAEIKTNELERLGAIQFGESGHISVIHKSGEVLKNEAWSEIEHLPFAVLPERAAEPVKQVLDIASNGGGSLTFPWKLPDSDEFGDMHVYVKPMPHWDWILVSGYYHEDLMGSVGQRQELIHEDYVADRNRLMLSTVVLGGLALLLVFIYTRWLGKRFDAYHSAIEQHEFELEQYTEALEISDRIVSSAHEGILVTDADNRIVLVNDAVLDITGYERDELIGQSPDLFSSGRHSEYFYKKMWQSLADKGYWSGEIWNRRKDGQVYPEWLNLSVYQDETGKVINHVATFSDISDRKRDQERLSYLAHYDPLTDLPNRRLLIDRLSQQMQTSQRNPKERVAVMFVDLDHFKNVNDTLGHGIGDQVLVEVANRIKACLTPEDTLSRVGGDEFAILIKDGDDIFSMAGRAAMQILEVTKEPISIPNEDIRLSASIGIAVSPEDGTTSESLMKHADTALFHAKAQGRNNFLFFTQTMNVAVSARIEMEKQIRQAIKEQQFELYYQPQMNAKTGKLDGVEVLIRWQKENGSFVRPDQFIPVAEDTGQIIEIGDWVMETAIKQIHEWDKTGHHLTVSINISPRQLRSHHLKSKLDKLLTTYDVSASQVVLEVTETALVEDLDAALTTLEKLQSCGVGLSLDDFGTGYSSLSLLKRASVDELKIDRSFIDGLPVEPEDIAITTSLVSAAHNLGIQVVAEGVETEEQLKFLQDIDCDRTQGYFYSPAIKAHDLAEKYFS